MSLISAFLLGVLVGVVVMAGLVFWTARRYDNEDREHQEDGP